MRHRTRSILIALACISGIAAGRANATTILPATDQGHYIGSDGSATNDPANLLIRTGMADLTVIGGVITEYHNFFTFDLSALAGQTVTGGTLEIGGAGFGTGNEEVYEIFDYTGSVVSLINGGTGAALLTVFNDLASGSSYGQSVVDTTSCTSGFGCPMPNVSVQLTPAALTNLNNIVLLGLNPDFAIGGYCITCTDADPEEQDSFLWFGIAPSVYLSLEVAEAAPPVPLPPALPLFAGGLGLLAWLGRRKR